MIHPTHLLITKTRNSDGAFDLARGIAYASAVQKRARRRREFALNGGAGRVAFDCQRTTSPMTRESSSVRPREGEFCELRARRRHTAPKREPVSDERQCAVCRRCATEPPYGGRNELAK